MKTRKKTPQVLSAFSAGLVLFATVASAATRTLPTPPPSEYVDTESSSVVSLVEWSGLGRHLKLTLAANVTPSNAVQVAFGTDRNHNEDLEPEETDFIVGIDCGTPFARDEQTRTASALAGGPVTTTGPNNAAAVPGGSTVFDITPAYKRYAPTLAKVTTRGRGALAASITAKLFNTGTLLILR